MDLDSLLSDIGGFGKYQKLVIWLILVPATFPCGFHAYNQLFMTISPDHWCYIPELQNIDATIARKIRIPVENHDGYISYSSCYMYKKNLTNSLHDMNGSTTEGINAVTSCINGWSFDDSQNMESIVTEWSLVCEESHKPVLALILFGVGGLLGSYAFGYCQDGLGRKLSFYIYLAIQCAFGIATAFAHDFVLFSILRFLTGITVPAILGTPIVLAIELVSPSYRTFVTLVINIGYAVSLCFLALVAYYIRNWRYFALATSVPFLLWFFQYSVCPESPRWLLAKGKITQLDELLTKISKVNKKPLPFNYSQALKQSTEESKPIEDDKKIYGIYDLFRYPKLRIKTILIIFIWFTNLSVYVGLSYYSTGLGGDEYLNFFLSGAVELPAYLILWMTLQKYGRRWNLYCTMVLAGIACIATYFFKNNKLATLILYCIGKIGISCAFVVVPLVASEIYPTVVRGLGMSVSSVVGMLGPIFIPIINNLGTTMPSLPLVIMGVMCLLGGLASLILPETLNKPLPQTLLDGEKEGPVWFRIDFPKWSSNKKIGGIGTENPISNNIIV